MKYKNKKAFNIFLPKHINKIVQVVYKEFPEELLREKRILDFYNQILHKNDKNNTKAIKVNKANFLVVQIHKDDVYEFSFKKGSLLDEINQYLFKLYKNPRPLKNIVYEFNDFIN